MEQSCYISAYAYDTPTSLDQRFADFVAVEQLKRERRETDIEEREEVWEKYSPRFAVSQLSNPIVLNVGGEKFSTSLETLSKVPNSYFSNLVSGKWELQLCEDGSVFIDRSPIGFSLLLQYLRDPRSFPSLCKHLTLVEIAHLKEDCGFYLMPQVLEYVSSFPCRKNLGEQLANIPVRIACCRVTWRCHGR